MFVFRDVSSMKLRRVSKLRMKGWRRVIQICRALRTSLRFCSTARRSFFMRQIETAKQPPDRRPMDIYPLLVAQFDDQFIKGAVTLLADALPDPVPQLDQLAVSGPALPLRFQRPRLALQLHHVVHELDRHAEMRRCSAMRMSFRDKVDNALTQRNRMRSAHL